MVDDHHSGRIPVFSLGQAFVYGRRRPAKKRRRNWVSTSRTGRAQVKLPDMDGFTVCRAIKGDPGSGITIVLPVSASYTSSNEQVHGSTSGADGYIRDSKNASILRGSGPESQ
jgi:hypothetical protein